MAYKRISSIAFIADFVSDLKTLPKSNMGAECYVIENACEYKCNSLGEWINQTSVINDNIQVDLSEYVTKDEMQLAINDTKANTLFGESEEAMSSNPGSEFGLVINKGDNTSIVDAMLAKGIGLYTFWISKGNPDLPAEVIAKNGSVRGLCCVDTVKDTGWYGWIQLFDHDGYMYSRYIRNSTPTEWRKCFS